MTKISINTLVRVLAMLAALALPLVLGTSCTSDELVTNSDATPGAGGQQITITATLGDASSNSKPGTRMDYTPDAAGTGLKTTWAVGDAFNIVPYGANGTAQPFTLDTGAGTDTGTFTGTAPETSSSYHIFHPANKIKNEAEFISFSYAGQVQKGNDSDDHLTAYHSMMLLTDNYQTINFNKTSTNSSPVQSSCMKFVLTPGAAITPTKITVSTADGVALFYPDNNTNAPVSSLSLSLQEFVPIAANGTITAYMMMSCQDVTLPATSGIIVAVDAADGSIYTQTITLDKETKLEGGKMHTITLSKADSWTETQSTTYTNTTVASTTLSTADGTATNAGTATNPYLIQGARDLKMVQDVTNDANAAITYKNKCYKLTTDITIATGTSWTSIGKDYDSNNKIDNRFKGTFDGAGHSVTGVSINARQQYAGFFGYITGGTVKNLNVTGSVKSSYQQSYKDPAIGGIAGYSASDIIECSFSGSVEGTGSQAYVGGIAGYFDTSSNIIGCNNSGSVKGGSQAKVGGIAGYISTSSNIIGCNNTGTVTTDATEFGTYRGGIAGNVQTEVSIIGCYNTGAVTGTDMAASGGIAGTSTGKVMGCYNTGTVTGADDMMNDKTCGGIIALSGSGGSPIDCLWVKGSSDATKGIGSTGMSSGAPGTNIKEITDIATLNSNDNIAFLNTAITTWNSDSNGGNSDTTNPKYCHYTFEAGTGTNATPVLVSTQQP